MRVARSTLEGNIATQDVYDSEPQRIALTALKPQGQGKRVATDRVSSAVGPAGRVQQNHVKQNPQGPGFSIFQVCKLKSHLFPSPTESYRP